MLSRCLRQCAPRQHAYQMGAIFWAGVNIAVHSGCWNGHPFERLGRKTFFKRLLKRLDSEHAVRPSTCYRYADVGAALGPKDSDQRETRRRMLELFVRCFL